MSKRMLTGLMVLGFGWAMSSARAYCPDEAAASHGDPKAAQATDKAVQAHSGCGQAKSSSVASDKAANDGRSEPAAAASGCCKEKHAAQASDKSSGCCQDKQAAQATDKATGGCPHAAKLAADSASGGCSKSKAQTVLASLPSMKYRVGAETTCCSKTAGEMAKKTGESMKFVVGEEAFETEDAATAKLASLLDKELESLAAVQYSVNGECGRCPVTAKEQAKKQSATVAYKVAGFEFAEQEKAEKVAKLVSEAIAGVKLSYKVGDEKFCCDKMAGAKSKETGKSMTYVVGDEETPCSKSAQLKLTEAKIRKAVETAAAALAS